MKETLEKLNRKQLRALAKHYGVDLSGTTKETTDEEIIELMMASLPVEFYSSFPEQWIGNIKFTQHIFRTSNQAEIEFLKASGKFGMEINLRELAIPEKVLKIQ